MKNPPFLYRSLYITALIALLSGCVEYRNPSHNNHPEWNGDFNEEFAKPPPGVQYNSIFSATPFTSGRLKASHRGREYARATSSGTINWLDVGEPLIVDGLYALNEAGQDSHEFDMLVLVDFQPVPFALIEVIDPEGYPTLEDALDLDQFSEVIPFTLENTIPFNFSIIIPPSSFPETGAYDIRLVPLSRHTPDPTIPEVRDALEYDLGIRLSVYYGGYEVRASSLELEGRIEPLSNELMWYLEFQPATLARGRAALHIFPLQDDGTPLLWSEENEEEEISLGQIFDVDSSSVALNLYSTGQTPFARHYGSQVKYLVFNGTKVLDGPRGLGTVPPPVERVAPGIELQAAHHPLEINLDEGLNRIRVLRFHHPYLRMVPGQHDHILYANISSQTLFFQWNSSQDE